MAFKPQTFQETSEHARFEAATNVQLEAKVTDALERASHLDASRVIVIMHDGTITLEGFVSTRSEIDTAGEVAGRIEGVRRIDNRLLIQAVLAS